MPKPHPRQESLRQRHLLQEGIRKGITTPTGLIAFGRGEAFDYLLGEKTTPPAKKAIETAAARLLLASRPVISVNGNTAALCPRELIALSNELNCPLEVNLFYGPASRRKKISAFFQKRGKKILGAQKTVPLPGLSSLRANVDPNGILKADTVLVPLEDGDRTQALKKARKFVIAIDLNPLSRTARTADISIVDNVVRAIPALTRQIRKMKKQRTALQKTLNAFSNSRNLKESEQIIRKGKLS
ncbi:MAG: phosphopantothenate/pantothenate synthetase [Candidatus Diapherotrites archaeon]|nr:phosphopantothenate/pantothenate synthetase [Candidatus Diapherotrites archaeon]